MTGDINEGFKGSMAIGVGIVQIFLAIVLFVNAVYWIISLNLLVGCIALFFSLIHLAAGALGVAAGRRRRKGKVLASTFTNCIMVVWILLQTAVLSVAARLRSETASVVIVTVCACLLFLFTLWQSILGCVSQCKSSAPITPKPETGYDDVRAVPLNQPCNDIGPHDSQPAHLPHPVGPRQLEEGGLSVETQYETVRVGPLDADCRYDSAPLERAPVPPPLPHASGYSGEGTGFSYDYVPPQAVLQLPGRQSIEGSGSYLHAPLPLPEDVVPLEIPISNPVAGGNAGNAPADTHYQQLAENTHYQPLAENTHYQPLAEDTHYQPRAEDRHYQPLRADGYESGFSYTNASLERDSPPPQEHRYDNVTLEPAQIECATFTYDSATPEPADIAPPVTVTILF